MQKYTPHGSLIIKTSPLSQGHHYIDVIMIAMASQITSLVVATQLFIKAQIIENIKAPRHWPLCGKLTRDRWIPLTLRWIPHKRACNAKNVSIRWRHNDNRQIVTSTCRQIEVICRMGGIKYNFFPFRHRNGIVHSNHKLTFPWMKACSSVITILVKHQKISRNY